MNCVWARLLLSFALLAAWPLEATAGKDADLVHLYLGDHEFRIPEENALTEPLPIWLRWLPGLDDGSRSALLVMRADELGKNIPGYQTSDGRYRDDITVRIAALTPVEQQRYRNSRLRSQLADLWFGRGSYHSRRVEPVPGERLYKVYRSIEYPRSWALLKEYPDPTKPLPKAPLDFWIAHCLAGGRPIGETGKGVTCRSHVLADDILIEFSVSDYNLPVIEDVRGFLKAKVLEWKQAEP